MPITNDGMVYIETGTTPKLGVDPQADVSYVLGRSTGDYGQLCGDVDENGVRVGAINPMAKWKPVRHSTPGLITETQRAGVRYGFATPIPSLTTSQNEPKNNWGYQPPRGINGGGSGIHERYRIRDFVKEGEKKGYHPGACCPIALSVGQFVYDAESQIIVSANSASNSFREDGLTWEVDKSLSLQELLDSNSSYYGNNIAFLLVDLRTYTKNLIVTGTTASALVGSPNNGIKVFSIYATETRVSGVVYPAVPILSSGNRGDTFAIIACLMQGSGPSSGYAYSVYTASTNPAVVNLTPYSLGFVDGCDRIYRRLDTGAFNMDNLVIDSVDVSFTDMVSEVTWNNSTWRAYRVTVNGDFDASNVAYSGEKSVMGTLELYNTQGDPFGGSPSTGDNPITVPVSISLLGATPGQRKLIFTTGDDSFLWLVKYNGSLINTTVTATLTLDYPLTEAKTESGSATTSQS